MTTHPTPTCPLDLSAPGAVDALLAFHRARFGSARMSTPTFTAPTPPAPPAAPAQPGAAPQAPTFTAPPAPPAAPAQPGQPSGGTNPPAQPNGGAGGQQPPADLGFPAGTALEDMTPQQQVAYWREQSKVQQRRADSVTQLGATGLAELQAKAQQLDALTAASQTDQQRAVAEAEQRVRAEVGAQYAARLVDANITAAVAGRVAADVLAVQLAPVDRRWFLTAEGDVDATKVATYAEQLAGAQRPPNAPPGHGAGYRPGTAPVGADAGRAMAERRFGKRE